MINIIMCICAGVFLSICAVTDIRIQKIDLRLVMIFCAVGVFLIIFKTEGRIYNFLGILPGAMLIILSKVTREAIGYGDGAAVLTVGFLVGIFKIMYIWFWACVIGAAVLFILLSAGKLKLKGRYPWIPIITAAFLPGVLI